MKSFAMRTYLYSLSILDVLIVLSCSQDALLTYHDQESLCRTISSCNSVTKEQLISYLEKETTRTRGLSNNYSIDTRVNSEGDTLMYIVNFNGHGWKILSADSRTPAILAEGNEGSFSQDEGSPALSVWMDMLSTDMTNVRRCNDEQLTFSSEEISANKAFWNLKQKEPSRNPRPPQYEGYWITHTTSETIVDETLEHMTPHWHQSTPYNQYCPLKSWSSTEHQPAGCVAVAGAQVLYYLHGKIGVPAEAYGTCSIVNGEPVFGNSSASNWDQMSPNFVYPGDTADKEAILIRKIGRLVEMQYSDTSSTSHSSRLKTFAFPDQGLNCNRSDYCQDTVKRYLNNQYPVIVSATDQLIPINGHWHCFVIDGYKKTHVKYTHCHEFIPAHPETIILPGSGYESYYTYSYSTPEITAIKINWGWWTQWAGDQILNDGWYTLTADWEVEKDGETYTYNHNVKMLYDFSIAN